jgi:copper chaperone CopZ
LTESHPRAACCPGRSSWLLSGVAATDRQFIHPHWGREMVRVTISGMSCSNCARHVREALSGLAGVTSVVVRLDPGDATIEATVPPDDAAIRAALAKTGYDVVAIEHT